MRLITLLLIIVYQISFASPFDLAEEGEAEETKPFEELEKLEIQSEVVDEKVAPQDTIVESIAEKRQPLKETSMAKIIMLDIRSGGKKEVEMAVGDSKKVDDINLKLKKCLIEEDSFYKKFSFAEVILNGRFVTISNDLNVSNFVAGDTLIMISCINKS